MRTSELYLIIRGQNQTANLFRKVAGDISALSKAANAANSSQVARVQGQIVASTTAAAKSQRDLTAAHDAYYKQRGEFGAKEQLLSSQMERSLATQLGLEEKLAILQDAGLTDTVAYEQAQLRLTATERDMLRIGEQQAALPALQNAALTQTVAKINTIHTQLTEEQAQLERLNTLEYDRAKAIDTINTKLLEQQKLLKQGQTIASIGRSAQFAGLVGTAALGGSAIYAAHFEQAVALASTQIASTPKGISAAEKSLNDQILKLAQKYPGSPTQQAQGAYSIFSSIPGLTGAGAKGIQEGYKLLELANKAAVAGNSDLGSSVDELIKVYNNFKNSGEGVDHMMNNLFAIVKYGNVHFQDLQTLLENIGPTAQGAHQSLGDLSGIIAELTLHMSAPQAGTGISRMLQVFARPSFIAGAEKLGVNVTRIVNGVQQLLPVGQILDNFVAKFGSLRQGGVELQNLVKEVTAAGGVGTGQSGTQGTIAMQRALNVLFRNLVETHHLQAQILQDNGELQRSYQTMAQTSGVRWSVFLNTLKVTALKVGQAVIPVFQSIGHYILMAVNWFNGLPGPVRDVVSQFAAWAAIILVVGGTLTHVVGILMTLRGYLAVLQGERALQMIGTDAQFAQLQIAGLETGAASLRATLLGLTAKAFIITALLSLIPGSKSGQDVLNAEGEGGFGKVPVLGHGFQQIASFMQWANISGFGSAVGNKQQEELFLKNMLNPDKRKKFLQLIMQAENKVYTDMPGTQKDKDTAWLKGLLYAADVAKKALGENIFKSNKHLDQAGVSWMKLYHNAAQALIQVEKKPSLTGWIHFNNLLDEIQKKVSPARFQAIQQMLYSTKPNSNVLPGATQISDAQWQKMMKNTKQLYEVAMQNPNNLKDWEAYYNALNQLKENSTAQQLSAVQKVLSAEKSAMTSTQSSIDSMVKTLETTFNQFQTQEETMFGSLFQGRIMTGPFGSVYSKLAQFNIAPPFKLLMQDLKSQVTDFENYRKDLDKLSAKGVPQAMLDELKNSGPQGRLAIQTLSNASRSQIQAYINEWKKKKGDIQSATTIDFNKQLAQWKSYGAKIAVQILEGLRSQSSFLKKGYEQYIMPGSLQDEFKKWIKKNLGSAITSGSGDGESKAQKEARRLAEAHKKAAEEAHKMTKQHERQKAIAAALSTVDSALSQVTKLFGSDIHKAGHRASKAQDRVATSANQLAHALDRVKKAVNQDLGGHKHHHHHEGNTKYEYHQHLHTHDTGNAHAAMRRAKWEHEQGLRKIHLKPGH